VRGVEPAHLGVVGGAGDTSELPELEDGETDDDEDPTAGFTYVIERDDTWH